MKFHLPSVITIAISSNLQGAATLVGDATAILMGSHAKMTFSDFFIYQGKAGMYWVVQAGAIVFTLVCLFIFRQYSQPLSEDLKKHRTAVTDYLPTFLLVGMIALLIVSSFIKNKPALSNGFICTGLFIFGLIVSFLRTQDKKVFFRTIREIDISTLLLLSGLFMVVAGITEAGLVGEISKLFVRFSGDNLFILYTLTILYFGLLSGATLGGNFTPIGASANITAIGILRKNGYEVKTGQYMKISVPVTFAAVMTGYILIWLIWC